jgi:hypothetical protein
MKGQLEDAAREFEWARREHPGTDAIYVELARIYLRLDKAVLAAGVLRDYLRMETDLRHQCLVLPEFGDLERYTGLDQAVKGRLRTQCANQR